MATGEWGELFKVLAVYWSLLLGNVVEWYEFTIYGYQARYLEKNFFKGSDVAVWLGFAITFLARPLGGLVLGSIGDRFGRSVAVNISIVGMLIGTCGQGCLPDANTGVPWLANLGLVLLVILRLIQGLSAGGEIATITTYLTEVASPRILSRGVAMVNITAALGFFCAKFVSYLLDTILGPAAVQAWGWRIGFLLAAIPGGIAIIGRRHIPESAAFQEQQRKSEAEDGQSEEAFAKMKRVLSQYWLNILLTIGVVTTHGVMVYGSGIWVQHFLAKNGMAPGDRMLVDLLARFINFAVAIPVAWAADKFGVGLVVLVSAGVTATTSLPFWTLVASNPTSLVPVMLGFGIGLTGVHTCVGTLIYQIAVENFPVDVRNTGVGVSYNVGMAVFGGLSPTIVLLAYRTTWLGPGIIYALSGLIGFVTLLTARALRRRGIVEIANIRPSPYFGILGDELKGHQKSHIGKFDNNKSLDESQTESETDSEAAKV